MTSLPAPGSWDERQVTGEKPYRAPYWYMTDIYECALCGRERKYRSREYGPRPEKWEERNHWFQDACSDHFL